MPVETYGYAINVGSWLLSSGDTEEIIAGLVNRALPDVAAACRMMLEKELFSESWADHIADQAAALVGQKASQGLALQMDLREYFNSPEGSLLGLLQEAADPASMLGITQQCELEALREVVSGILADVMSGEYHEDSPIRVECIPHVTTFFLTTRSFGETTAGIDNLAYLDELGILYEGHEPSDPLSHPGYVLARDAFTIQAYVHLGTRYRELHSAVGIRQVIRLVCAALWRLYREPHPATVGLNYAHRVAVDCPAIRGVYSAVATLGKSLSIMDGPDWDTSDISTTRMVDMPSVPRFLEMVNTVWPTIGQRP